MDNEPYADMSESERLKAKSRLYGRLLQAMQSGVKFDMETWKPRPGHSEPETSRKHLRVGVNSAMCDHSALVRLLVAKGLVTDEEYLDAICDQMADEIKSYERTLTNRFGKDITLG